MLKLQSSIDNYINRLSVVDKILDRNSKNLEKIEIKLDNNNPKKISNMGYSKVIQNGKVVNKISKLKGNSAIISMIDGKINCKLDGW